MNKVLHLITVIAFFFASLGSASAVTEIKLYFPPKWKDTPEKASRITDGLSHETGIKIVPQIADCNLEILTAMTQKNPVLAYVGSMVTTVLNSRKFGTPLLQVLDNRQSYGGIMLTPKGGSPSVILQNYPAEIAYSVGTTSGEVCAKAATGGQAAVAVPDHASALEMMRSGRAKAAFIKSTWWEEKFNTHSGFDAYSISGVSEYENGDNILLVSNFVTPEVKSLIRNAAIKAPHIFNADGVVPFDSSVLGFTLKLMKTAGIDPLTYSWEPVNPGQCANKSAPGSLDPSESADQEAQTLLAGERALEKHCGKCHLVTIAKQNRRKSREQWEKTIIGGSMRGGLTDEELDDLIQYLLSLKKKKKSE